MFKFKVDNETELRLLEFRDAERLFELIVSQKEYLKQWLPWVDTTKTIQDTKFFIEMSKKQFVSEKGFQAGIWYKKELVGVIGFHGINWDSRLTSIGYWLGEKYQGNGIMTKCCQAMIKYAFEELNLNRIEIRCAEENTKSRSIPEKLGFEKEGTIRDAEWLYDHFVNHIVYGKLSHGLPK